VVKSERQVVKEVGVMLVLGLVRVVALMVMARELGGMVMAVLVSAVATQEVSRAEAVTGVGPKVVMKAE